MIRPACILLAAALFAAAPAAWAAENQDLDRIPDIQQDLPPPDANAAPASAKHGKYYVEDAFSVSALRNNLAVPYTSPYSPRWQNRTSLDGTDQWNLADSVTVTLSDRFNLIERNDSDFPARQNVRNDFREGFVTWEPTDGGYLETGRINVRNGVALGYNPTDFFKTRTGIDLATQDPSAIRQNRLGVFMVRGQIIGAESSASLSVAPKLDDPAPLAGRPLPGWSPRFERTNADNRFLATYSHEIGEFSPQALVYHEGSHTQFGLNVSHGIGRSIIAYAEWAGGRQPNEITQALSFGKRSGTFNPQTRSVIPTDGSESFRNDFAGGFSWTSAEKVTINAEYHYHQAGLSQREWDDWVKIGRTQIGSTVSELWYFRGYAADQQQPLTRHQAFVRAVWTDAFVSKLELAALAFVNLYDGSTASQLSATYYLDDRWTLAGYLTANLGEPDSERGTALPLGTAVVQLVRYF